MDLPSIVIFQIIADVVLCIAVLFMLLRIGRIISTSHTQAISNENLSAFQKSLDASREDAAHFFHRLDESYTKFKELAMSLEREEERLKALIEEVQGHGERFEKMGHAADHQSVELTYQRIMRFLDDGLSIEEIAERSGLTAGEVVLISNLESKKKEMALE